MKALTALLEYLTVLLEYIDLYHGFQPHSKKDNFSEIFPSLPPMATSTLHYILPFSTLYWWWLVSLG